jgi:deoxyribodipyrimidine photolyase
MIGNPICRQIPWYCQDKDTNNNTTHDVDKTKNIGKISVKKEGISSIKSEFKDEESIAALHLQAWENGKTGYPYIDAAMIQLRQQGWIHHLARHSVACFLTRGDLWISWEKGAKVFDRLLLDAGTQKTVEMMLID